MVTQRTIGNINQLIDAIGAGPMDSQEPGPETVVLTLWNGHRIVGKYYRWKEGEVHDIESRTDIIADSAAIWPFAEALLNEGTPFTTITGSHDMVCSLRWEIEQ